MNLNPRIVIAFVLGLFMVGGSFYVTKLQDKKEVDGQKVAGISSSAGSFRNYIEVNDQDKNGLPDWQESLNLSTINLDETPQKTLSQTGALAVELATRTSIKNNGPQNILTDIGTRLVRESYDKQYAKDDVLVGQDNSSNALRIYGNKVASIVFNNAPPRGTENELTILNRAFLRNDPVVLNLLAPTISSYEGMIKDMLEVTVPSSMLREHLSLLNVYQAILSDIKAFQNVFDDALPAMTRFRRYQADTEALYLAITMLYGKLARSGIQWSDADVASKLINVQ